MNARKVFIETFGNYHDAESWMDKHLEEHKDWYVIQADLKYINGSWRAGCIFERGQLYFHYAFGDDGGHLNLHAKELDV